MKGKRIQPNWAAVIADAKAGMTLAELHKKYGPARETIARHLRAAKVTPAKGRRGGDQGKRLRAEASPAPSEKPRGALSYTLVARDEKLVNGGRAESHLKFQDSIVTDGVPAIHRIEIWTVPNIARQFELGQNYVLEFEKAGQ